MHLSTDVLLDWNAANWKFGNIKAGILLYCTLLRDDLATDQGCLDERNFGIQCGDYHFAQSTILFRFKNRNTGKATGAMQVEPQAELLCITSNAEYTALNYLSCPWPSRIARSCIWPGL